MTSSTDAQLYQGGMSFIRYSHDYGSQQLECWHTKQHKYLLGVVYWINQLLVNFPHPGHLPKHFKCRVGSNQYLLIQCSKEQSVHQFVLTYVVSSYTQIQSLLLFVLMQLSCVTVTLCSNHYCCFILMYHCCVIFALSNNCHCRRCFV